MWIHYIYLFAIELIQYWIDLWPIELNSFTNDCVHVLTRNSSIPACETEHQTCQINSPFVSWIAVIVCLGWFSLCSVLLLLSLDWEQRASIEFNQNLFLSLRCSKMSVATPPTTREFLFKRDAPSTFGGYEGNQRLLKDSQSYRISLSLDSACFFRFPSTMNPLTNMI